MQTGGLRQHSNKASYTVTPVTCGWAGAVKEKVTRAFGQEGLAEKLKNAEKIKRGLTNQPTDGWTNKLGWSCIARN